MLQHTTKVFGLHFETSSVAHLSYTVSGFHMLSITNEELTCYGVFNPSNVPSQLSS